jgi:hypothetical protein
LTRAIAAQQLKRSMPRLGAATLQQPQSQSRTRKELMKTTVVWVVETWATRRLR